MTDSRKNKSYRFGLWAELYTAVRFMIKGYRIQAWRYKTPVGEIDLIVRRGDVIAFVEVKARRDLSTALQALTPSMKNRITRGAQFYLAQHPAVSAMAMRFDFVAVAWPLYYRHLDNAWSAAT